MQDEKPKDWKKIIEEAEQEASETSDSTEGLPLDTIASHPEYIELNNKLDTANQTADEHKEKAARAYAELENVRRRAERDVANAHRYGQDKLINSLLPVLDSLEQAISLAESNSAMAEGLALTLKLFLDTLTKFEVQEINPEGQMFNPEEHEAMSMQVLPDAKPNSVVTVFQKGYRLAGRVIRPARVIVAKNA